LAEQRRTFRDLFNRSPQEKRYNFFNEQDSLYNNVNFLQGWNTSAGAFDISSMGNGASNSAVTACLQVLGVSFSEATLIVKAVDADYVENTITNHPLSILMRRPNPFMSGDIVQQYIMTALHVSGDAYLLKQRNNANQLVALYPLMPESVEAKGNDETLITKYEYNNGNLNQKITIMPEDIVHIRLGLDSTNHRKGFAPLKTVLREIYGDESAGQMATALVANSGVPNVLITPKDEFGPSPEEAEQIARTYKQKTGGKNRGMPLVLSGAMNVEKLAFSPKELDIGQLRRIPEERISAVLGVPAILAGLGAGLERATYSNAKELREFFTENKLIPLWKQIGEELTQQILLVDYTDNVNEYACYDFADVRALQQDTDELYNRLNVGVQGGWITVAEAREAVGLPTDDTQNVYLIANSQMVVPAENMQDVDNNVEAETDINIEAELEAQDDEKFYTIEQELDGEYSVVDFKGGIYGTYPTKTLAEARLIQVERLGETKAYEEE
jgi:HK97 family phage portal protein